MKNLKLGLLALTLMFAFSLSAQKKISQLPELITPDSTDVLPIVNDGVTKKITVANLLNAGGSTIWQTTNGYYEPTETLPLVFKTNDSIRLEAPILIYGDKYNQVIGDSLIFYIEEGDTLGSINFKYYENNRESYKESITQMLMEYEGEFQTFQQYYEKYIYLGEDTAKFYKIIYSPQSESTEILFGDFEGHMPIYYAIAGSQDSRFYSDLIGANNQELYLKKTENTEDGMVLTVVGSYTSHTPDGSKSAEFAEVDYKHLSHLTTTWTTATRPTDQQPGCNGYNTTDNKMEYWNGSIWVQY